MLEAFDVAFRENPTYRVWSFHVYIPLRFEWGWYGKFKAWEKQFGWNIIEALQENGILTDGRGREMIQAWIPGNCHMNMLHAKEEGSIDQIWVGFGYEEGRWHCHVWGSKDGVLKDATIVFNEYYGVKIA